jgi:hypothetical protein
MAADPVTDEQIAELQTEAGEAGDRAQVALCRKALDPFRPQPFSCRHCGHVGDRRVHDEARCGERCAAADAHDDTLRGLAEIAANRRFGQEQTR